ncbi:uncharacterized protein LOC100908559 [Galendromus occidentalis]|uniref:Uncharacterized protein LOC100908559 n=1 Tax=Galendromus occidentalis TaxID=34638 RepID=A0AAJ6QUV6_9ACAR|nr:uncharacterized protein LOC100908559 [Galendromus occidentalis]
MAGPRLAILTLFGVAFLGCSVSATILIQGKHTDNTCTIRGDWKYIKTIDETITEVFPEINNRDSYTLVDIRKSPVEVLDLFTRYNYKVASANTLNQDTIWTLQKRREK